MKAATGGRQGLEWARRPRPEPSPEHLLVRVRAAALNRADLGMLAGHAHGSAGGAGAVLGLEWAGEVVAVGLRVSAFAVGDRVMCSGSGGFAGYAVTDQGRAMRLPDQAMGFEQAATLPVALQTMHDAIVTNARLCAGDTVLIQGASSGVGLMGLQIARLMGAGKVIGTSTNAVRRARLTEFGADLALDSSDPQWPQQLLAATDGHGADVIIDQLAGSAANANMAAAALGARIVNVGRLAGMRGDFDFDLHALKRIQYIGVTFRTRTVEQVRAIQAGVVADLGPHLARGALAFPIDCVYPFDRLGEAFEHMRSNAHFGKIVVRMPESADPDEAV